ncbi:hypothetical protein BRAS3843_1730027 [Bradyrhizobium sp. STM 3843]|nr:hypothetical protein BRAS3843_1730027 [Bradyrhizobium sp. STM 3843]
MSARTFLDNYDKYGVPMQDFYEKMLGANENGMSWANAAIEVEGGVKLYCMPDSLALAPQQNVQILRQYVTDHPEHAKRPFGLVLLSALRETFPCPAGKRP